MSGVFRLSSVVNYSLRCPKTIVVLSMFLMLCCALGFKYLYFRGDYKVFFEPQNTQRLAFESMQDRFSRSENIMFLVRPHSGHVLTPPTLSLLRELTESAWQLPLSTRVESLTNFQFTYSEVDGLVVGDLVQNVPSSSEGFETLAQRISSLPELDARLINSDKSAAVVDVTLHLPDGDTTREIADIVRHANLIRDKLLSDFPQHDIDLVGIAPLNNAFSTAAQADAERLIPAMFAIILLTVLFLTSSWATALATLIIVATSIIATLGIAGWSGIYLSSATVNVPTMVMTLAVADCVHIIVGAQVACRQGVDKFTAIATSVTSNFKALLITSITTAAGFLTLNFSEVPILAHLGNLTAFGVMVAFVLSVTLLPSMLALLPFSAQKERISSKMLYKWGDWVIKRSRLVLFFSVAVLLVSLFLASTNQLNDVVVEYFGEGNTFKQAVNAHEKTFGGMSTMDFAVDTSEEQGVTSPANLALIESFVDWLRSQPETLHVMSLTDTLKRLNMNLNGDNPEHLRLPEDRSTAAQYLLLYEMSLPFGLDVNNQINMDKSAIRLVVTLPNLGSKEIIAFEARAREKFRALSSDLSLSVASPALMFAHIGEQNMKSMVEGTVSALVLISVLIWFALASTKLGLASLASNLIPAACGFAVWALISGQINMALSVVLSMTMGIIVDDTVHFLAKYQTARKSGLDPASSIKHVFSTVGIALSTTTLALMAGFSVLMASSFVMNAEMGALTVIIIGCALAIDFLFLPALLLTIDREPREGNI